jgi:pyridoxamine 5'-phosphate oxidase
MSVDYKSSRRDFLQGELTESEVTSEPFQLLNKWYEDAAQAGAPDPNAMALATINSEGYPTSRIVLMRDLNKDGLSFFTNYQSDKGHELELNSKASVMFFWPSLERQVRVLGTVLKIPEKQSDAYFMTRPRESQIGAWASPQSQVIKSRVELEKLVQSYTEQFAGNKEIPRPPHWGGYVLKPISFEFWQGRESRLHDRLKAQMDGQTWAWTRLAP